MWRIVTPEEFAAIERRWSTNGGLGNGRSADDYDDAGCRIIAGHGFRDVDTLLSTVRELQAELKAAVELHRDLTGRLGYGDDITEPQADNSTIVEAVDNLRTIERDHWECPRICERCGEALASTVCEHCHGGGCLPNAEMAYLECEWCAGVGRVHVGCVEESYVDLAAAVRERDNNTARVRALLDPDRRGLSVDGAFTVTASSLCLALDPQETE